MPGGSRLVLEQGAPADVPAVSAAKCDQARSLAGQLDHDTQGGKTISMIQEFKKFAM